MSVGDTEDEAMAIVHSLRALTVDLNVAVSGFATKYTMHSTDVRALICLLDAERASTPATPGWLGSQLGINSASVTALVDRLVKAGHVARERDSADRRRVLLQVTPAAVTLGEDFFGPLISRAVNTVGNYTATERATIARFIVAMRADVERARIDMEPSR
ncbi:MarR family transcriptional regulator [Rhodococcus sp. IEGM 1409]|uniref:MarR family winged helix-turn-helix transcriptional regulator n=1 Tax=Rhodococcus sp. IEGM 1409 TaxID=3047082 RepID=UPI0024B7E15D|nr:MarR family transcriptional regulator [Rhodococcus sp. IEGM 1409]MDI9901528.1 MarR family transcriptional regulator [Rhodococcus sp. IEGM 1409]